MPENYWLKMDYEFQGKKEEIHKLKSVVFEKYVVIEIYILSITFHKIFFFLWIPTLNSAVALVQIYIVEGFTKSEFFGAEKYETCRQSLLESP
jgi:hypothetical protein